MCEAKNPDDLYKKMKSFMALPQGERELMGKAGRKHMEDVFDKKTVVRKTVEHLY